VCDIITSTCCFLKVKTTTFEAFFFHILLPKTHNTKE
jgi:hypothetical protein